MFVRVDQKFTKYDSLALLYIIDNVQHDMRNRKYDSPVTETEENCPEIFLKKY